MMNSKNASWLGNPKPRTRFGKIVDLPSNPPVLHSPSARAEGALRLENADKVRIGSSNVKL